jgi:hypothetical protein
MARPLARLVLISVVTLPLVLVAVDASPAWGRGLRVRCADGAASALVVQRHSRRTEPVCDLDQTCDGACTFGFCDLAAFRCANDALCAGGASGICAACGCPDDTIVVEAGHRRVLLDPSGAKLVLQCKRRCARCTTDAACDDGNPCSLDRCLDGTCAHDCLCVAPGTVATCCPGPLTTCPPPTTACGPDLRCDGTSQICVSRGPIGPAVTYACEPVPAACQSDRSCACTGSVVCQPPFDTCRDMAPNAVFCECVECQ